MRLSIHRRALAAAIVVLVSLVVLPAAAEAKPRIGPSGDAFYHPPKSLVKGKHGTLIWARKANRAPTLAQGSASWTVLYRSVSPQGKPIAVSGLVTLPRGKAPRKGWGVVSWSHGTAGIADVCAPSRDLPNASDQRNDDINPHLNATVAQGYVVARSDFEGLGTSGTHPYLVGVSEGRGSVDIVSAAHQLDKRVGTRWVSAGHSQGGQAALFAAALGPQWAPRLQLEGVAAFAPVSHVSTLIDAVGSFTSPLGGLSAGAAMVAVGASTQVPGLDAASLFTPAAAKLYPQISTARCVLNLAAPDSFGGLAPADLFAAGSIAKLHKVLEAMNPSLKISVPILMLQGLADTTVIPRFTDMLSVELKAKGDKLDYKTYAGKDHDSVLTAGRPEEAAFYRRHLG